MKLYCNRLSARRREYAQGGIVGLTKNAADPAPATPSATDEVSHLEEFFIIALIADYANGVITHHSFCLQRLLLVSGAFGRVDSLRRNRIHDIVVSNTSRASGGVLLASPVVKG